MVGRNRADSKGIHFQTQQESSSVILPTPADTQVRWQSHNTSALLSQPLEIGSMDSICCLNDHVIGGLGLLLFLFCMVWWISNSHLASAEKRFFLVKHAHSLEKKQENLGYSSCVSISLQIVLIKMLKKCFCACIKPFLDHMKNGIYSTAVKTMFSAFKGHLPYVKVTWS